jgi:hypothetical protein
MIRSRSFQVLAVAIGIAGSLSGQDSDPTRQRLQAIMPTKADVEKFLRGKQGPEQLSQNRGWVFDADLGWVLCDSIRSDGVGKSKTFYHYENDGARKVVNSPERTCRIHTYGDSFTHGDQVSDGETWQEHLAAHLQEPIRNYGVGGYSVYQAYRRMLKVEEKHPVRYVILNIYDDDHYRNLDSLRSIRFGRRIPDGFPLPHLRVDVAKNRCDKAENLLRKPEDAYQLCDEEFVYRTFKDDPILRLALAVADKKTLTPKVVEPIAASFGILREQLPDADPARQLEIVHTKAALFATRNVIGWTEEYMAQTGKKLLIVLSFNRRNMQAALEGKPRFDQELLDWLKDKPYPVIDMRDAFRKDFSQFKGDVASYLDRYYNGHHSPAGNFFTAWALKNAMVKWLDPAPLPYR